MKVYISGPITGMEDSNRTAFTVASARAVAAGHSPVNPLDSDPPGEPGWLACMKKDIPQLIECDAIAMLHGWRGSRGASLEYAIATGLGLTVFDAETFIELRESVCAEADRLVSGDRQADYDHPLDNFGKTAMIWQALLHDKLSGTITAEDVGLCMIGVKLAREAHRHKRDNLTDAAGYAKTVQLCHEERAMRGRG